MSFSSTSFLHSRGRSQDKPAESMDYTSSAAGSVCPSVHPEVVPFLLMRKALRIRHPCLCLICTYIQYTHITYVLYIPTIFPNRLGIVLEKLSVRYVSLCLVFSYFKAANTIFGLSVTLHNF